MNSYTDDNILIYTPLEGIRKKLGMYVGSTGSDAANHVIKEIISNAIDEYLAGYGREIVVELLDNNSVRIADKGRGIPLGSIVDVATKPHSSGKFKEEGKAAYGASGGLNGIGLKIATATGTVSIKVVRDGKIYTNSFSYLEGTGTEKIVATKEKQTGTEVTWKPDDTAFSDNTLSLTGIRELLTDLSYLTPGLTFKLVHKGKTESISAKSIAEFITDTVPPKQIVSPVMTFSIGDSFLHVEGALAWTKNVQLEKSYVNLIPTDDGGTHCTALKTVLTREMNKFLNSDLKGTEIRNGLVFILSVKVDEEPVFKGQSKDSLNMPTINAPLSQLLKKEVEVLLSSHKKFFEDLLASVMQARKKLESSDQIRDVLTKARSKANPIPNKLKPALNTKGAELFITEGLSASGSLIQTRDVYKHAIMSLKGKPINFKKHDMTKVLKNEEIQDLIIAMGGFGETFTADKCAYDKIVIATDADADGSHIRLLLISFFFEFYPQLIRDGKIYAVETPLYIIKKGQTLQYVFTESEMEKVLKTLPKSATYSRLKGLGELNQDVLAEFAFSPKRRLVQYRMTDEDMVEQLLENFMGVDGDERREFVS